MKIKHCLAFFVFLFLQPVMAASWTSDKLGEAMLTSDEGGVYQGDFTVAVWVNSRGEGRHYPVIASNKNWVDSRLIDMTSSSNFGTTLESGTRPGWVLVMQPSGAWAWNVGNGRARLDYMPTAARQTVADGEWHLLAFSYSKSKGEARLYYDGRNVAVYSLNGIGKFDSGLPTYLFKDGRGKQRDVLGVTMEGMELSVVDEVLDADAMEALYHKRFPSKNLDRHTKKVKKLRVMAWNIWHGGKRSGTVSGVQETIDVIKASGADVICMQETYGSGPVIADHLGYYFYLRSSNISVMSRYPIEESCSLFDPFRLGGVKVAPNKGQAFNVFSLWIHYLPAWRNDSRAEGASAEALVKGEWGTRAKELKTILERAKDLIGQADKTPLVIAGDFNSPSHLDWTEKTKKWHNGLAVTWPVSKQMEEHGFTDTFRSLTPNLLHFDKEKNWRGGAEKLSWRIDYIFSKGKKLQAERSTMWNQFHASWPSDHPLVITEFSVR